jgi:hypothetical protein
MVKVTFIRRLSRRNTVRSRSLSEAYMKMRRRRHFTDRWLVRNAKLYFSDV